MSSQKQWIPLVAILAILGLASLVFVLSLSDAGSAANPGGLAELEQAPPGQPDEGPELSDTVRGPVNPGPPGDASEWPAEPDGGPGYRNRIHGLVTSASTADRLPRARVELSEPATLALVLQMGGKSGPPAPIQSVETDSQGRFQFFDVPAEKSLQIVVSHADHAQGLLSIGPVSRVGDSEEFVVCLEEGFRIEGNVFDKVTSAPIHKARLLVRRSSPIAMWMRSASAEIQPGDKSAESDTGGYFEVANAPRGAVNVIVQAEGYAEVRRGLNLNEATNPAMRDRQDFHLAPGATILGRVENLEGELLADVHIQALCSSQNQTSRVAARSDAQGAFELRGLQDGEEYILRAMLDGYLHEGTNRHRAGEQDVVLKLASAGRVVGRVINGATHRPLKRFTAAILQFRRTEVLPRPGGAPDTAGANPGANPLPGLDTQPVSYTELRQTRREIQSRDGTFELAGITVASEYLIKIEATGLAPQLSRPFNCNKGVTANVGDIAMGRGGSIEGAVQESGGEPIAMARVFINCGGIDPTQNPLGPFLGPIGPQPLQRVATITDAEGRFRADGLIPTPGVNIHVTARDFSNGGASRLEVRAGELTQVPPIVLKRGGTVFGLVLKDGVAPMAGIKVVLRPLVHTSGQLLNRDMVTGKPGKFRFPGIPEGKYRIHAAPADAIGNPFEIIRWMKLTEQTISVFDGTESEVTIAAPTAATPFDPLRPARPFPGIAPGEHPVPKPRLPRKPVKGATDVDGADSGLERGGDAALVPLRVPAHRQLAQRSQR